MHRRRISHRDGFRSAGLPIQSRERTGVSHISALEEGFLRSVRGKAVTRAFGSIVSLISQALNMFPPVVYLLTATNGSLHLGI